MRMTVASALAGLLLTTAVRAQSPPPQIATRVEIHPIASLTLSDGQFLNGDAANAKPVTVAGELRIAQAPGKQPAVILMHGSGGVGANIEPWVDQFNAMGIATFVIDGFTGRGIVSTSADQAKLGRLNLIVDIYRALGILAKHPRIDADRIVLMGFSRGGQAALYASLDRFHKQWNTSGAKFAAYIPFYPDCSTTYRGDTDVAGAPIRIFHGTPDDYNPVASCKAFAERLKAAKRDIVITEYDGAPHGFDTPLSTSAVVADGAQTVRNCHIMETDGGTLINEATKAPFAYTDACVALGPHVGGNATATAAARIAVKDIMRTTFKLGN